MRGRECRRNRMRWEGGEGGHSGEEEERNETRQHRGRTGGGETREGWGQGRGTREKTEMGEKVERRRRESPGQRRGGRREEEERGRE